ncbi:VOC family protein [Rhizobium halophytocola]|uniref:Lactoylglutathione lyase n=1 Tax=Rhizobium halophytocola TaxID=735519 RepID=A0ABS4E343_9HYPH|nr:VOC family protein [Rhizobium halophytocola]MBP1852372.1 lactoylglutathione lyase [Rhizobium halophytocola]
MSAFGKDGVTGLYETHLPVARLERAIDFYENRLGLERAYTNDERRVAFFWVGGKQSGMLGLWETGTAPLGMRLHFAFHASEEWLLDGCSRLRDAGISPLGFHGEAVEEPVVIGWVPAMMLYFKDPDGHSLEALHVLPQPPDRAFGIRSLTAWRQYAS